MITDNKCDTQVITVDWRCTETIVLGAKVAALLLVAA